MEKIKISVAILSAAFENQKAVLSMQCLEIPVFQKFDTGIHMNVDPSTAQQPYTIKTAIIMLHNLAIFEAVKMRLY